jgi:hypothetical protein
MPLDRVLPLSQLPADATTDQIARHFAQAWGLRVDLSELHVLPAYVRLSLAGARPPEPPEAALLDRVLQVVPTSLLTAVDRLLIVDTGETGRPGSYDSRIIRIRTPALDLRRGDPEYGNEFSAFTTTVVHELGHAVYEELLHERQREILLEDYIMFLERSSVPTEGEPTEPGTQHHLAALLLAALLGYGKPLMSVTYARLVLAELGIPVSPRR